MELHELSYTKGSRNHKRKIVGRGHGSGMGKTSGRGQDGQKARKSGHTRLGFEGGQTPLYRRLPKVGFNNVNFSNDYNVINLKDLQRLTDKVIDIKVLEDKGYISKKKLPIKIIGNAKVNANITIKAHKFTAGALKAIEQGSAKAEVIAK